VDNEVLYLRRLMNPECARIYLAQNNVQGQLAQFQLAQFEKLDMRRVVKMINAALGESALAGEILDSVCEMWWPLL
jgi:hypothetical protein